MRMNKKSKWNEWKSCKQTSTWILFCFDCVRIFSVCFLLPFPFVRERWDLKLWSFSQIDKIWFSTFHTEMSKQKLARNQGIYCCLTFICQLCEVRFTKYKLANEVNLIRFLSRKCGWTCFASSEITGKNLHSFVRNHRGKVSVTYMRQLNIVWVSVGDARARARLFNARSYFLFISFCFVSI